MLNLDAFRESVETQDRVLGELLSELKRRFLEVSNDEVRLDVEVGEQKFCGEMGVDSVLLRRVAPDGAPLPLPAHPSLSHVHPYFGDTTAGVKLPENMTGAVSVLIELVGDKVRAELEVPKAGPVECDERDDVGVLIAAMSAILDGISEQNEVYLKGQNPADTVGPVRAGVIRALLAVHSPKEEK